METKEKERDRKEMEESETGQRTARGPCDDVDGDDVDGDVGDGVGDKGGDSDKVPGI